MFKHVKVNAGQTVEVGGKFYGPGSHLDMAEADLPRFEGKVAAAQPIRKKAEKKGEKKAEGGAEA